GFYIGGNVGGAFAEASADLRFGAATVASGSEDLNGVIGGGQIGANWQTGMFVLGVEGDFQGASQQNSSTFLGINFTDRLDSFATVRGRAGIAHDRWLVYATGGWAWLHFRTEATVGGATFSTTDSRNGWTIGGGIERALASNWTAKLEYL